VVVRDISDAKAELSALIEAVQGGSKVIIAKAGRPVARPRKPGAMAGEISIAADFDTLPDDMAEAFGMKESQS
jgi:antitoxin (DNA-binding transcriptional repressor) of toxin-antitoxin stability system